MTKLKLQNKKQELEKEYVSLENEKNDAETIITCQTRKNAISLRQEEIKRLISEIDSELLEENEEHKKETRILENQVRLTKEGNKVQKK